MLDVCARVAAEEEKERKAVLNLWAEVLCGIIVLKSVVKTLAPQLPCQKRNRARDRRAAGRRSRDSPGHFWHSSLPAGFGRPWSYSCSQ
jgi:hypothetical protein